MQNAVSNITIYPPMDFKLFFKRFQEEKDKIEAFEKQLKSEYTLFVTENRKEIKKFIPPNGSIVKYIGDPQITYEGKNGNSLKSLTTE